MSTEGIAAVPVGDRELGGGTRTPLLAQSRTRVDQTYLRLATYRAANATLIEHQASIPLAQAWGGGLVASVDGMRFVVPVPSVYARPNPRRFGRRGGATWLNMINDQAAGLGGKVVAGTPRDSLYVLDVLYDRDGGKRPEMIVTDTASYSDIVFGLLTLAGFAYAPQLADLPDQKMWRIDRAADYGAFQDAARGRVDLVRIERHWEDILRIIGSIHTGAVRAYDVIRMLSRDGRPTPLGDAIAHYGRIAKTLHILRLADEPGYRRQIKVQANLQEGRHALARKIFHGRAGQLYQRYQDGMEDQIGASWGSCGTTSTCWAATPSRCPTCPAACGPCAMRTRWTRSRSVAAGRVHEHGHPRQDQVADDVKAVGAVAVGPRPTTAMAAAGRGPGRPSLWWGQ